MDSRLEPSPQRQLLTLAWPVILARATQSIVGFCDALMITPLGEASLAAVTTGALDVLTLVMLPMGISFILQSFSSQLRGRGDLTTARRYADYGLLVAAFSALPSVAFIPALGPLLSLIDYAPDVREGMEIYIAIRLLSVAPIIGTEALNNWYGGLGNTRISLLVGLFVLGTNVGLNYALIEPRFGLPGYGIAGAAAASTIASTLGFLSILACLWLRLGHKAPRFGNGLKKSEFSRMLRFGVPSGLNYFLEFSAFALFINVVVGHLGTTVLAAFNIVFQWSSLAFMPAFGVSSAGAILVGEAIGHGRPERVGALTRLTLKYSVGWMFSVGVLYLLFPRSFISLFASDAKGASELFEVGALMLALSGLWQVFDAIALTLSEVLRAAGDTTWPMVARIALAWFVFTPIAWTMVLLFDGGPTTLMLSIVFYIACVAAALIYRYRTGAWKKIALLGQKEEELLS